MDNSIPINQEEMSEKLKGYINRNQNLITSIGIGVGIYFVAWHNGYRAGYIKGHDHNFNNLVDVASKVTKVK